MNQHQISLWYKKNKENQNYYGTFADNLKTPIHRWFKYPAGYSYKFVQEKIKEYSLDHQSWILDPFVGCGTTIVESRKMGINSVGIEVHPFVYWVAKTKVFWDFDLNNLSREINNIIKNISNKFSNSKFKIADIDGFPELLRKCYSEENLIKLKIIKNYISENIKHEKTKDFLNLALTDTLRAASKAGTGWPYIAPNKYHEKEEKDSIMVFSNLVHIMYKDLLYISSINTQRSAKCILIQGDARENQPTIPNESIDLVITSPPYLNNYDYADRTRLELYFFGYASTWGEITLNIRHKLLTAATTQVNRSSFDLEKPLNECILNTSPIVYNELMTKIRSLSNIRLKKGGKKSYDLMVAGYFNDMHKVFKQVYNYLKRGNDFILVLGDSAPYGIHIPTEEYLGELALGIGYSTYNINTLRIRGKKWANNPQRHKVLLRESILQITK